MGSNIHRSGRSPMVSAEEIYRQAQRSSAKKMHQRRMQGRGQSRPLRGQESGHSATHPSAGAPSRADSAYPGTPKGTPTPRRRTQPPGKKSSSATGKPQGTQPQKSQNPQQTQQTQQKSRVTKGDKKTRYIGTPPPESQKALSKENEKSSLESTESNSKATEAPKGVNTPLSSQRPAQSSTAPNRSTSDSIKGGSSKRNQPGRYLSSLADKNGGAPADGIKRNPNSDTFDDSKGSQSDTSSRPVEHPQEHQDVPVPRNEPVKRSEKKRWFRRRKHPEEKKVYRPWRKEADIELELDDSKYDTLMVRDNLPEATVDAGLSDGEVEKINDAYAQYSITQQTRSNSKKVEKPSRIYVVVPRRKKIHKVITSWWTLILVIAICAVSMYGYTVKKDAELSRIKDDAYAMGINSSSVKPDITNFMKMDSETLTSTLLGAQGVSYPANTQLSRFDLVGWNTPGGNQTESTVEVNFCYQGDNTKLLSGSAFLFTPDIVSVQPQWTVDTVSLTQVPCGENR